jgi:hypothetical protein
VKGIDKKKMQIGDKDNPVTDKTVSMTFDTDWKKSLFSGYDLNITAADVNDNVGYLEEHIPSVLEAFIMALLDALKSLAEFIMELASAAIQWIWDAINLMMSRVIDPIVDSFTSYFISFTSAMNSGCSELISTGILSEDTEDEIKGAIYSPFFIALLMIPIVLLLIQSIVKYFAPMLPWLMLAVFVCILAFITLYFTSSLSEDDIESDSGSEDDYESYDDEDELFSWILGKLFGDDTRSNEHRAPEDDVMDLISAGAQIFKVVIAGVIFNYLSKPVLNGAQLAKKGFAILFFGIGFGLMLLSGLIMYLSERLKRDSIPDSDEDQAAQLKAYFSWGLILGTLSWGFYALAGINADAKGSPLVLWILAGFIAQSIVIGCSVVYFLFKYM